MCSLRAHGPFNLPELDLVSVFATVGSTSSSACQNLIWLEYVQTQVLAGKWCHSPQACKTYISTDNTNVGGNVSWEMYVLST